MDKRLIEKFSKEARIQLLEKVKAKAIENLVEEGKEADENLDSINGVVLDDTRKKQRRALIQKVKQEGYEQVMEEAAYTWFNRFFAIRYMEVNGYLPSHVRVFSDEEGRFKPQIMAEAIHLDLPGLDMERVMELKAGSQDEELFKYLLLVQCNALNEVLPYMFSKIEDYTELLLPDYLLREGSVIEKLVEIPEENFVDIEVLGWAYQYYISEKHEEVVDPLHGKVVKKEEVPAATQLFTTDWVVKYLVDNSVGRYWIERNPASQLAKELSYFVVPKNGELKAVDEKITPQDVTVFDPCVGSGHFLVYAFDVLMKIYVEYGFSERDAAVEIVKNNIFGLDIDGRATQLAYFAVMMKARQYDRRFFTRGIQPKIYEITESNNVDRASIDYFCGDDTGLRKDVDAILEVMTDAKEYGTILHMPKVDFGKIDDRFIQLSEEINMYNMYLFGDFKSLIEEIRIMSNTYAIVDTNPPYLNKYDAKLKDFINLNYKEYNGDLFSVFMYRNFGYCKCNGYTGFMTPFVWMFIKSYETLRQLIINEKALTTLIQMEYSAFEEATVPICSFVLKNGKDDSKSLCFKLSDFKGGMEVQREKTLEAIDNKDCGYFYEADTCDFKRIPGSPISFWVSEALYQDFEYKKIQDIEPPRFGMSTSDNNRFVRIWHEVDISKFAYPVLGPSEVNMTAKWYPYNNGGEFRRWYGDNGDVVNWENDGEEIKGFGRAAIRNKDFYYKSGITWTAISSAKISVRAFDYGFLFSSAGFCIFEKTLKEYILAFMNCKVGAEILRILSPTINFNVGDIARLPIKIDENIKDEISKLAENNIAISREDWDSFETSWDFKINPLIKTKTSLISTAFELWKNECEQRFIKLKNNEESINTIFINVYGLQEELDSTVEDKDVTVRQADLLRDIKNFISYSVGCIFGRYSLDDSGLAFAGGIWNPSKYKRFIPDMDAIIPICDDEYFEDDIVSRFVEFVEVVYGKDTLEENLQFIANSLGGNGSAREVIRNYFINDFYADHLKVYQKRPIYWLFDSGKKNGFKCLVYMHRYQPDTIARIRTDYVHEQQARYRTAIEETENRLNSASGSDKVKLSNKLKTLKAQSEEIHIYEEKIHHLADQMIDIDLDDGVKENYAKFQDVLAKIK